MSGAARKNSQLKPVTSEFVKVRTLTTESWALAYQPSQTSVKAGRLRRTQTYTLRPAHQRVLEEEDRREDQQGDGGDADETVFVRQIFIQSGSSIAAARRPRR